MFKFISTKKFLAGVMSLAMGLSLIGDTPVFAEDVNETQGYVLVDTASEYYALALETLQLTEEEASNCNIYAIDGSSESVASTYGVSIPNNGQFYYFPTFTFSRTNGGAYWTCNGNRLKYGFHWQSPASTSDKMEQYLQVSLYQYPATSVDYRVSASPYVYNEQSFTSSWLSVQRCDHRFFYSTGFTTSPETPVATVTMFVATTG